MNEQDYERMVDALEQRFDNAITHAAVAAAQAAAGAGSDGERAREDARDAVEALLFNDEAWERVEATDISDIAYDAAERAWSQLRAWGEV